MPDPALDLGRLRNRRSHFSRDGRMAWSRFGWEMGSLPDRAAGAWRRLADHSVWFAGDRCFGSPVDRQTHLERFLRCSTEGQRRPGLPDGPAWRTCRRTLAALLPRNGRSWEGYEACRASPLCCRRRDALRLVCQRDLDVSLASHEPSLRLACREFLQGQSRLARRTPGCAGGSGEPL